MPYSATNALAFCQRQTGRYRDGECWTLMEDAVVAAGGQSSIKLTPRFSPAASFVWGDTVAVGSLQPGDVLQFSGYKWEQTTVVETTFHPKDPDNPDTTETLPSAVQERGAPQHSAMVVKVISAGVVEVIEQNIPRGTGPVQTVQLVLIPGQAKVTTETEEFDTAFDGKPGKLKRTIKKTTTEVVTAAPRCYRPKAR
ncbi:MAG: hypothetical protein ACRC6I_09400 [Paracoccaceae bacterium]